MSRYEATIAPRRNRSARRLSGLGRSFGADDRADFFAEHDAGDIARYMEIEDVDRHAALPAKAYGRSVHHLEVALYDVEVRDPVEHGGRTVGLGIGRVDAFDLGRLEYGVGLDFERAKRGGRIGREVRVAGARGEDYDSPFLYVADGPAANERLGDFVHLDGGHHAGKDVLFFEGILQGKGVHNGGEHAHVIGRGAIHPAGRKRDSAKDVSSPDDYGDFNLQVANVLDLFRD